MKITDRSYTRGNALAAAAIVLLASSIASSAKADSIRWRTVVGILQAGNVVGGVVQNGNVVGGITGGGQPWTTLGGRARIDLANGRSDFDVQGLVLAGGNAIGTPDGINMVTGTLVCIIANSPTPVTVDTIPVPLSPQGDADFSGTIGPIPTACNATNVAFLIRIAGGANAGRWIANGAVRTSPGNN